MKPETYRHPTELRVKQPEISITTPVAFFIFNRPALTERIFARIAEAKPQTLFIIADGPRFQADEQLCRGTRTIVDRIDWDCQVFKEFSDHNLGCKRRVSSGLDWVFSQVEEAIILEDDCLPAPSFFSFCQELLEHYRNDKRIFVVSGDNFQFGVPRTECSYYFSRYPHCWGWASWRRAWNHFDLTMNSWPAFRATGRIKEVLENPAEQIYWITIFDECYANRINSWAYIWTYTCWREGALTVLPEVNLVSNLGFGVDSTHTADLASPLAKLPIGDVWRVKHPKQVIRHAEADDYTFEHVFRH
jgi:hypothetical protein